MAKFPTYEEMAKNVAEKALDEFLCDGRSIREWMQIIASEDCISRQAAIDAIEKNAYRHTYLDQIIDIVNVLPPVTLKQRIGKWIKSRDSYGNNHFTCPFCEHDIATKYDGTWEDNYCSNCGARLKGDE